MWLPRPTTFHNTLLPWVFCGSPGTANQLDQLINMPAWVLLSSLLFSPRLLVSSSPLLPLSSSSPGPRINLSARAFCTSRCADLEFRGVAARSRPRRTTGWGRSPASSGRSSPARRHRPGVSSFPTKEMTNPLVPVPNSRDDRPRGATNSRDDHPPPECCMGAPRGRDFLFAPARRGQRPGCCRSGWGRRCGQRAGVAVDETVILLTLSLHRY